MGFRRSPAMGPAPAGPRLSRQMVGIGMLFAAEADVHAPIEPTLVHASAAGMDGDDLRVLSILTTWIGIHAPYINVDRLARCLADGSSPRVGAYWASVAQWQHRDRRFARVRALAPERPVDLLPVGTDFQLARQGADERFSDSPLRVVAGTLRDRRADVIDPPTLAQRHRGYRNRVLMGPTWRADVWTILDRSPQLSVAEVARQAGCSFATAWRVVQDARVLGRAAPPTSVPGEHAG